MKNRSNKQANVDRRVAKIKQSLSDVCAVCHRQGATDLMHILPKSIFPEFYAEPLNLVMGHRDCHRRFDDDFRERQKHMELFERASRLDKYGAIRHFKLYDTDTEQGGREPY